MASTPRSAQEAHTAKVSYLRFDVTISGGPPWRVTVAGHGGGRVVSPVPDEVEWVVGPTNRLRVDIHRRLERFAVAVAAE